MNDGEQRISAMVANRLLDRVILQPEDFRYHFNEFKTISNSNLLYNGLIDKELGYHGRRRRQQQLLKVIRMSEFPDVYGGFSDVYRGAYRTISSGVGGRDSEETIVRDFDKHLPA
jgi:hypothetical protein